MVLFHIMHNSSEIFMEKKKPASLCIQQLKTLLSQGRCPPLPICTPNFPVCRGETRIAAQTQGSRGGLYPLTVIGLLLIIVGLINWNITNEAGYTNHRISVAWNYGLILRLLSDLLVLINIIAVVMKIILKSLLRIKFDLNLSNASTSLQDTDRIL